MYRRGIDLFLTLIQSAYFYKMNQITDDEADERKIYAHFAKHRDIASYDLISMFYAKHYASQYLQWAQRVCRKKLQKQPDRFRYQQIIFNWSWKVF